MNDKQNKLFSDVRKYNDKIANFIASSQKVLTLVKCLVFY